MTAASRIAALRSEMKNEQIDVYIVPTSDYHASEYVGEYFKSRAYLTGFTGSAGTAVITQSEAGLFTDGRYFVQAQKELTGSGVTLFRMGTEGTPSVLEYVDSILTVEGVIGFDGRCISAKSADQYRNIAKKKNGCLRTDIDLVGRIWYDRPPLPKGAVSVLDQDICGETAVSKIERIRNVMREHGAGMHLISSLYDIAWILNIRGCDIRHVPVPLAYLCLTERHVDLFIDEDKLSAEVCRYLNAVGIRIFSYDTIYETLSSLTPGISVLLDRSIVNESLMRSLPEQAGLIDRPNPSERMRAIKNKTEIENTRQAHIRDGAAVTKFIFWLKQNIGNESLTEYSAAAYLDQLRAQDPAYLDLSFDTISAYGANAAMMHYQAKEDSCAVLREEGMLLVDSGGHYRDGTTDITRTIVLGELTQEQRQAYTRVLIGNLRLARAHFLEGCTGLNLDILAREKLWEVGIDYRCGTGHGVGHILNVHEGPNAFRWRRLSDANIDETLQSGMITTNEPGVYVDGEYGIRIENELLCIETQKNEYGQFLAFDVITYCPIDLDAVIPEMMEKADIEQLNAYHAEVFKVLSPYLSKEEQAWLYEATRPI